MLNLENEKEVLKLKYEYYKNKHDQQEESLKTVNAQVDGLQTRLQALNTRLQALLREKSESSWTSFRKMMEKDL